MTSVAELLERERERRALTQRQYAAILGLPEKNYRDYLAGRNGVSLRVVRVAHITLGLDASELLRAEPFGTARTYISPRRNRQFTRIIEQEMKP